MCVCVCVCVLFTYLNAYLEMCWHKWRFDSAYTTGNELGNSNSNHE